MQVPTLSILQARAQITRDVVPATVLVLRGIADLFALAHNDSGRIGILVQELRDRADAMAVAIAMGEAATTVAGDSDIEARQRAANVAAWSPDVDGLRIASEALVLSQDARDGRDGLGLSDGRDGRDVAAGRDDRNSLDGRVRVDGEPERGPGGLDSPSSHPSFPGAFPGTSSPLKDPSHAAAFVASPDAPRPGDAGSYPDNSQQPYSASGEFDRPSGSPDRSSPLSEPSSGVATTSQRSRESEQATRQGNARRAGR